MDDLGKGNMPAIRKAVELLRLHAGRLHICPSQVVICELSIWDCFCLLCYGLDGRRAVDGLFGAHHIGHPTRQIRVSLVVLL